MLYDIHRRHDCLTHIHTHDKFDKKLASKYLCIHWCCRGSSSVVYCQIFPTGQRHLHLPPSPPHLRFMHIKGRILVYLKVFFDLLCFFSYAFLSYLPPRRHRQTEINHQFFPPLTHPRFWAFGRRETRFHLLGRSVHPINAFKRSPSVLCQSQSPS